MTDDKGKEGTQETQPVPPPTPVGQNVPPPPVTTAIEEPPADVATLYAREAAGEKLNATDRKALDAHKAAVVAADYERGYRLGAWNGHPYLFSVRDAFTAPNTPEGHEAMQAHLWEIDQRERGLTQ